MVRQGRVAVMKAEWCNEGKRANPSRMGAVWSMAGQLPFDRPVC